MATLGEPVVGTAVYGPVRTVVWEDGGREAPSYPIFLVKIITQSLHNRDGNFTCAW